MDTKKSFSRICPILFVMVFILAQAPLQGVHAAGVRYAMPGGTGGCLSWADACSLKSALTGASSGDQIWAAAGTYKPTTDTADRDSTFQLKEDVAVYGGFAGTETKSEARDPIAHVTILSGDIDNNDDQTPIITDLATETHNGLNSYHVVTGASGATLDGFTITAGNANGNNSSCPSTGCGAGLLNNGDNLTLTNVTFSGNSATFDGGGMDNRNLHNTTITNVTFNANSAPYGGGMLIWDSSVTLTNVTFSDNKASVDGGGMYNVYGSLTLTNVTFKGNSSTGAGGGMHNRGLNPTITNVTFSGNAAGVGGGMYNSASNPMMTNVTFSGNSAVNHGGGMYIDNYSYPQFYDTIFWGNTAPGIGGQIYNYSGNTNSSDSIVQGGCADASWTCGTIILTADPMLGTLGNYGGFTQTISLLAGSAAIDMGNDATCAATDQRGITRPQGSHCDIGAYEFQTIMLAVPDGLTSGLCESWAHACELRYALTSAVSGQEIWAAAGIYSPTMGTDRSATFQLKDGVALYGGFAGTETARTQRDPAAHITILSGDIDNNDTQTPIITDLSTETHNTLNSYHVVTGATGATLDGFTITAGFTADSNGGGMYNSSSSPTVMHIIFSGNSATYGGGMYNNSSNPTLTDVTFSHNAANPGNSGGGIYNISSSPALTNVTFSNNSAGYGGGLFNHSGSNPTLTNVTFSGNTVSHDGGGLFSQVSSSPTLTNVTFSGNTAPAGNGGGMYNYQNSPQIHNTIFWGNTAGGSGAQVYNDIGGNPTLNNSVVQGDYAGGTNIITADPNLGTLGDYGGYTQTIPLLPGSSAIDAGNSSNCTIGSDQRSLNYVGNCDIGAFESQGFSLTISGGNNQSTLINTTFPLPLKVDITALNAVEPVNGGQVVFTAPASGASATLSGSPATIAGGSASVTATANGSEGSYQVMASAAGAGSVTFDLENFFYKIFLPLVMRK
jgi:parallel beta-helix repeat protein